MIEKTAIQAMTREELEDEVIRLRTKYVWGLQVEDIASCVQKEDVDKLFEDKGALLSDEQLHNELLHVLVGHENFAIYDWVEYVQEAIPGFSKKTTALLFEYQKRALNKL